MLFNNVYSLEVSIHFELSSSLLFYWSKVVLWWDSWDFSIYNLVKELENGLLSTVLQGWKLENCEHLGYAAMFTGFIVLLYETHCSRLHSFEFVNIPFEQRIPYYMALYSRSDLTRAMYAVFLQLSEHVLRLRLSMPRLELAFLIVLVIWSDHESFSSKSTSK